MTIDKGFEDALNYVEQYLAALEDGAKRAQAAAPLLIRQEFIAQSKRKLDSTRDHYLNALDIRYENDYLLVELDPSDKLAVMLEEGSDPFDMHKTLLTSSKAKVSKKGHRYMSIPMEKTKKAPSAQTDSALQQKIQAVMNKPTILAAKTRSKMNRDGSVQVIETLDPKNDPDLKGFYRVKRFRNSADMTSGASPIASKYVMFRMISENPESKSAKGWVHPGIQKRGLFPAVEQWANIVLPELLMNIVNESIEKVSQS